MPESNERAIFRTTTMNLKISHLMNNTDKKYYVLPPAYEMIKLLAKKQVWMANYTHNYKRSRHRFSKPSYRTQWLRSSTRSQLYKRTSEMDNPIGWWKSCDHTFLSSCVLSKCVRCFFRVINIILYFLLQDSCMLKFQMILTNI